MNHLTAASEVNADNTKLDYLYHAKKEDDPPEGELENLNIRELKGKDLKIEELNNRYLPAHQGQKQEEIEMMDTPNNNIMGERFLILNDNLNNNI